MDLVLIGKESSTMEDTVGVKLMMIGALIEDLEVGGSLIKSVDGEFCVDGSSGKRSQR